MVCKSATGFTRLLSTGPTMTGRMFRRSWRPYCSSAWQCLESCEFFDSAKMKASHERMRLSAACSIVRLAHGARGMW